MRSGLDEKTEAWQEIIQTMPDCSMKQRMNLMRIDSFHATLKNYIALQKQDIQNFCSGDGFIYSHKYHNRIFRYPLNQTADSIREYTESILLNNKKRNSIHPLPRASVLRVALGINPMYAALERPLDRTNNHA